MELIKVNNFSVEERKEWVVNDCLTIKDRELFHDYYFYGHLVILVQDDENFIVQDIESDCIDLEDFSEDVANILSEAFRMKVGTIIFSVDMYK